MQFCGAVPICFLALSVCAIIVGNGVSRRVMSFVNASNQRSHGRFLYNHLLTCDLFYSNNIPGHHGCVNALAYSREREKFLVSGGDDRTVRVWNLADVIHHPKKLDPTCMNTEHRSKIIALDLSCNNSFIYSGDFYELVQHDFETKMSLGSYKYDKGLCSVSTHPHLPQVVMTASNDGLHTLDMRVSRTPQLTFQGEGCFRCVTHHPIYPNFVAASSFRAGSILYDSRHSQQVITYHYNSENYESLRSSVSVCFDSSGTRVLSTYKGRSLTLHGLWSEEPQCVFSGHRNVQTEKSGCFMGQNDEFITCGSDDGKIYIWNTQYQDHASMSGGEVCNSDPHLVIPGHGSVVNHVHYSKLHHLLASSGEEELIKVWSDFPINSHSNQTQIQRPTPS